MFSKKTVLMLFIVIVLCINIIFIFYSSRHPQSYYPTEKIPIYLTAPFQEAVTISIRKFKKLWHHYFFLVSASQENDYLKKALSQAVSKNTRCEELEKSNNRLRKILRFNEDFENNILVAEVVAKEPSIWFKSIIINKGIKDGLHNSLPVVIPQGVVGVITNVSDNYSKVMLLIDQSSGIDVIVQRTRVRGIVKGGAAELCTLEYVSRRYDIRIDDVIISSGLDGIFPKGLRVGHVSDVIGQHVDIFQKIVVTPYVNFETVEEVIVILNPGQHEVMSIK